jgi:hypothetical protein
MASFGFDGLWQSCTTFVPCSQYVLFELLGAALSPTAVGYFENCSGLICTVNAPRIRRPLFSVEMPVFLPSSRQATCRRFRPRGRVQGGLFSEFVQSNEVLFGPPGPPTTQTYGGDPAPGVCIFPPWADISFSNARGWAPMSSIGFRRPRRTSPIPMPMHPSSVSPAPGFISSTRKPANSSARTDVSARTGVSVRTDAAAASVPARTQGAL